MSFLRKQREADLRILKPWEDENYKPENWVRTTADPQDIYGKFINPKAPEVPAPPQIEPPKPMPIPLSKTQRRKAAAMKLRNRRGRQSTILTSTLAGEDRLGG